MDYLFKLGEQFLMERLVGSSSPFSHLTKIKIAAYIFIALLFLTGAGFIFYAFHIHIIESYSNPIDIFTRLGFSYMILSIVLAWGIHTYSQYKKKQYIKKSKEDIQQALILLKSCGDELEILYQEKPEYFCLISFIAGLILPKYLK